MPSHVHTGVAGSNAFNYWFTRTISAGISASATTIIYTNNDGTQTRLYSAAGNFIFTIDGVTGAITLTGGTITSMARTTSAGASTFESVGGLSYAATTFQARLADGSLIGVATDIFAGADRFTGGNGNDFFRAFGGNDTVNGGQGFDTVSYSNPPTSPSQPVGPITATLGTSNVVDAATSTRGTVTAASSTIGTDTLISVEQIIGTGAGDTFTAFRNFLGSNGNAFNQFEGLAGDDTITGNGSTRIDYSNSFAAASGSGVTVVWTNSAANTNGAGTATGSESGTDTFTGVNAVRGTHLADMFAATGASTADFAPFGTGFIFEGRGGNDVITGGGTNRRYDFNLARYDNESSNITVTLGTSNTVGAVTTAAGTVTGTSAGTDTLSYVEGIRGSNSVTGDVFTAFRNFRGFGGDFNSFEGMAGNDTVNGNGNTRIQFSNANGSVNVTWTASVGNASLGNGTAFGNGSVGTDTFTGVNAVQGTNFIDSFTATGAHGFFTFDGRGGDDFIQGGTLSYNTLDFDTARYSSATSGVTITLGTTTTVVGDASVGTDTLTHVERFRGSHFDDVFFASTDFVASYGLFNVFDGGGGNDDVFGNGSTRIDYTSALAGVTVSLATGIGQSTVADDAQVGIDTFTGVNGIQGSDFADVLTGSDGSVAEQFRGGAGADAINGGGGVRDQVNYRNSNAGVTVNLTTNTASDGFGFTDTLSNIEDAFGSELNDSLTGNSLVNYLIGQGGNDSLFGGGAADILYGDDGANLYGAAYGIDTAGDTGNDFLDGGTDIDTMVGGLGSDIYVVDVAGDVVTEAAGAAAGNDTVRSATISLDLASYTNVENLLVSGALALSLTGNAVANILTGSSNTAANVLTGLGGNDTYVVGAGDTIVEGAADGTADVVSSNLISLDLANYANVENLTATGTLGLSLTGNAGVNILTSFGDTGANVLSGLGGNDTYVIGAGDTIVEGAADGTADTVSSSLISLDLANYANVEYLSVTGALALSLTGNAGANILTGSGNTAANVLSGLGGNDVYVVGAGDTIVEGAADGTADTVLSNLISLNLANYANVENVSLAGTTAGLNATGNSGNNLITGNAASNVLTGAGGSDDFVFNTALGAGNIDTIVDFDVASDTIRLENAIMTALTIPGTLAAGAFVIGSAAVDADDRIIYDSATGALSYDSNGSTAGGIQQIATLSIGLALTNADFLVI